MIEEVCIAIPIISKDILILTLLLVNVYVTRKLSKLMRGVDGG